MLQFVIGLTIGYVTATLSESILHRCVGHSRPKSRSRWTRVFGISSIFERAYYGHTVVHHGRTFRANHVTQFRTLEEQKQLDSKLIQQQHSWVIQVCYGLITDLEGAVYFVAGPVVLVCASSFLLFGSLAFWFLLAACLPIISTPLLSRYLHPYLHLPIHEAIGSSPLIIVWLLQTRYGRWARISHFTHHRHPRYNFNLLPGGDYVLRTYKPPTDSELAEMYSIELI